jgi:hypothetical protein
VDYIQRNLEKRPTTTTRLMTETDISTVLIDGDIATIMGVKYQRIIEPKSPVEEAYKRWWGDYPPTTPSVSNFDDNMWSAFQKGYTSAEEDWKVEEPTKPMNEVLDRLENKYENDEVVNRMLKKWEENPPEFLKFELGRSLEDRIYRWWETCFVHHPEWSMEECVEDLLDIITLFLPKEQDSSGTQSASAIDLVDGYNDALTKIKSKLRNKK